MSKSHQHPALLKVKDWQKMQEVQDTADESKNEVKDERRYMDPQTYEDHKTAMEKDRQFFFMGANI